MILYGHIDYNPEEFYSCMS